jgi:hypothetical protein
VCQNTAGFPCGHAKYSSIIMRMMITTISTKMKMVVMSMIKMTRMMRVTTIMMMKMMATIIMLKIMLMITTTMTEMKTKYTNRATIKVIHLHWSRNCKAMLGCPSLTACRQLYND